jgi:hypothetical protein
LRRLREAAPGASLYGPKFKFFVDPIGEQKDLRWGKHFAKARDHFEVEGVSASSNNRLGPDFFTDSRPATRSSTCTTTLISGNDDSQKQSPFLLMA